MKTDWDAKRWPNFARVEVACTCCGELELDDFACRSLDALQRMRNTLGKPVKVESGHRCASHNATIGGAVHSMHLSIAFDIALQHHDRAKLLSAARAAGFTAFGFMKNGLHADMRAHPAVWDYGPASRRAWQGVMPTSHSTFEPHPAEPGSKGSAS